MAINNCGEGVGEVIFFLVFVDVSISSPFLFSFFFFLSCFLMFRYPMGVGAEAYVPLLLHSYATVTCVVFSV